MMQASKLVVAWYIRDRIQRKRRQQKRKFNSGLRDRATKAGSARGDAISRWVAQIPETPTPPEITTATTLVDAEEANFTMDTQTQPIDQETKIFQTVDTLIRSQTKKIELPLLGILDLAESDVESEDAFGAGDSGLHMDTDESTGDEIYDDSDENDEIIVTSDQDLDGSRRHLDRDGPSAAGLVRKDSMGRGGPEVGGSI